jgi:hypothetical protein
VVIYFFIDLNIGFDKKLIPDKIETTNIGRYQLSVLGKLTFINYCMISHNLVTLLAGCRAKRLKLRKFLSNKFI